MSVETNKALVVQFMEKISQNDIPGLAGLLHEKFTFWAIGAPHFPGGGTKTKSEFIKANEQLLSVMPKGMLMQITGIGGAEGNTVWAEVAGHGVLTNGRNYDNLYCFIFVIADDKILSGREYLDTLYANTTLHDSDVLTYKK